jgi:hypothetical protein
MNIKIVRLNSGEEILCDLVKNDDTYTLKSPLIIIPQGQGQIGFMGWIPYADTKDGVEVSKSFVAFTIEPDTQLKNDYSSHISGIVVPQQFSKPIQAGPVGLDIDTVA